MKKFFGKLIRFIIISVIAYFFYKFYKRAKAVKNMSKSLPLFLKNTLGEKPELSINMNFNKVEIKLGLPAEILEGDEDIEQLVEEYINDFYPAFSGMHILIGTYETDAATEESEEETVEEEAPAEETKTEE